MTQAAGEVLQGFSRGLTMFFPHCPAGQASPLFRPRTSPAKPAAHSTSWAPLLPGRPGPGELPASKGAACTAGRAFVLYSTGSFRVSVTSIRSPSRQISMVT